ncbi:TonB-dependent receptor [Cytophaga aurantiaca]|uniref:TonB-dependent receptor n=1 Tax=Cytophaga aurantiaca TaxID=29530 RepID=UPI0003658884|nr:TonB-dependent receptor [Cytophaga aurantiaca]
MFRISLNNRAIKNLPTYIILLITLFVSFSAIAQKGIIKGQVVADSSQPVEYAMVYLKGTSLGTVSDEEGMFCFTSVTPGTYTIVFSHVNFQPVEQTIIVTADQVTDVVIQTKSNHDEVVVTGTLTEKNIQDSPIPVTVITDAQIKQMGSMRLSDVLQEQTGLAIVNDHGTGIQLQGFNPEYTMIMIDGSPLIGRTAGTFDLTRITVGNIKQIEIVKGPSSSLYGSEALAGVINIITQDPKEKTGIGLRTRYGTNNTADISLDGFINTKRLSYSVFANRYSTSGYDLIPDTEDKTVAPYHNYTLQQKIGYQFNTCLKATLFARGFYENQNTIITFSENGTDYRVNQVGSQYDWNLLPQLSYAVNQKTRVLAKLYSTYYHTDAIMTNTYDGSLYDDSYFNQTFNRPEAIGYRTWNKKNETILGLGVTLESINSTRYTDKQKFNSTFYYIQHDWKPTSKLNIVGGFRFDAHSVYGHQLSPKLSVKYDATKTISFRASVGKGFKAPDFRQLYLNFTNPVAGYSVFGSEEVLAQYNKLNDQGLIAQTFIDPTTLAPITAERSIAVNIGWSMKVGKKINWQFNVFRNDISNMIETSAIAMKTNGQSVYTYYNVSKVFTEGFETSVEVMMHKNLTFSAGYQYLIAKNKEVIEDIKEGKYFARDPSTLVTSMVTEQQYGGLFNRSKHMANFKLFYLNKKNGWNGTIRAIYRGRYGFGDMNGNLILDADNEYVSGYWLANVSLGKSITPWFNLQLGVDNVFNYTNPQYISSIPGRLYYTSIQLKIHKK